MMGVSGKSLPLSYISLCGISLSRVTLGGSEHILIRLVVWVVVTPDNHGVLVVKVSLR